jgi:hypothetical protein
MKDNIYNIYCDETRIENPENDEELASWQLAVRIIDDCSIESFKIVKL